ncbi:MAG TPA: glycosyltransferase [Ktedonobacterales bacterium]|nr:glycosyltransferase [Ktedonobacterales bacterium]
MADHRVTSDAYAAIPRASVVIPTYNRCASLERVLRALGQQTVAPATFEVVLVADGCTDNTGAMCRQLAPEMPYDLRVIEQENAGPAAARNRGVYEARAALIVFIDDDVVPDERLIEGHLAAHTRDGEDNIVALGPLLPPLDTRLNAWGAWEERSLCGHYAAMQAGLWQPTYRQFYTGNASLYKRHILAAGGFNTRFLRAEDIELGLRMRDQGCQFVFLPEARGWHYVHRTFASWARMPVAYGHASITMGRNHHTGEVANLAREYAGRNLPTRFCVRLCLGSPARVALATHLLHALAVASWTLRISVVTYASCGILYNLRYYMGLASELGGRRAFWDWIHVSRSATGSPESYDTLLVLTARLLGHQSGEQREPTELGVGV